MPSGTLQDPEGKDRTLPSSVPTPPLPRFAREEDLSLVDRITLGLLPQVNIYVYYNSKESTVHIRSLLIGFTHPYKLHQYTNLYMNSDENYEGNVPGKGNEGWGPIYFETLQDKVLDISFTKSVKEPRIN